MCSTWSGAAQNDQCMTSKYRKSDKRADGSLCFRIALVVLWCHTLINLRSAASSRTHLDEFAALFQYLQAVLKHRLSLLADMLTEYKPNRPLRSLGSSQLEIPRVHTKQGESAFSYYAARSWNQLPEEIRCAKTLGTFKSRLKTHLFSCAFVEWTLCYVRTDCTVFYV